MSPETEDNVAAFGSMPMQQLQQQPTSSPGRQRIRKQDSYLRAVGKLSTEDELTPLPTRVRPMRKQDSYQRAMQSGSLSFSDSFDRSAIREEDANANAAAAAAAASSSPRTTRRAPVKKQGREKKLFGCWIFLLLILPLLLLLLLLLMLLLLQL